MAAEFIAGTSGRVALAAVTLTGSGESDMPPGYGDNTFTIGAYTNAAEINSWKFSDGVSGAKVVTFESATTSAGVVYGIDLRGGVSTGANFEMTGFYDRDTPTSAKFQNGVYVVACFHYSKLNDFGYQDVVCKVTKYQSGGKASADAFDFSATLEVQGAPPAPDVPA